MEAHRRPGRRRTAGVMDRVRDAERPGAVHPAVRPVEPGVVREEIEQDRYRQPPEWPGAGIGVDQRPAALLPAPGDDACWHAVDGDRGQRPADFPPDLGIEAIVKAR